jgi:hypothetical protein
VRGASNGQILGDLSNGVMPRGFGTNTRAREEQADRLVREILEIADDANEDVSIIKNEDGSTYEKVNQEAINRVRSRRAAAPGTPVRRRRSREGKLPRPSPMGLELRR